VAFATAATVLVIAAGAAAYFTGATGTNTASARIGTLNAPTITSATPGAGTVALSWNAVSAPAGGTVKYYVRRDGTAPAGDCPTSSATSTATSCTDSGILAGTYSYTVTAVWQSWTATSAASSVTVASGALDHFVLAATTTTPIAGAGDNLTITAEDVSNTTVTTYTGSHSLTFGGASNSPTGTHPTVTDSSGTAVNFGSATAISFASGVATVSSGANGVMTLYKAETASITATDGVHGNGSGPSVTVAPAGASSFSVPTPATQTAGVAFSATLTALDAYGNTATGYTGAKTIVWSGPSNSPNGTAPSYPSAATSLTFSGGTATATGITLYDAQTTVLAATQGLISGTSGAFAVNAAGLNSFTVGKQGTQAAGTAFNAAVTALDQYGNAANGWASAPGCVVFSGPASSPSGTAPAYPGPTASCSTGQSGLSFNSSGQATASITLYNASTTTNLTVKDAATQTKTGSSGNFTVTAGSNHQIGASAASPQTAGTAFNVTLTAQDSWGNATGNLSGTKNVSFSGPSNSPNNTAPSYPATASFSGGNATASVTLYKAETTTITANDTTDSLNGTASNNITVNTGTPAHLWWKQLTTSIGGTLTACTPFNCSWSSANNQTLTGSVSVTDAQGNIVSDLGSGHTVSISGAQGTFTSGSSLTIASTGQAVSTGGFSYKEAKGGWTSDTLTAVTSAGATYASATVGITH
jgi:hypothetical protein